MEVSQNMAHYPCLPSTQQTQSQRGSEVLMLPLTTALPTAWISRSGAADKENGLCTHDEFYSAVKNEQNYVVFRKREGLETIKVVKQAGPGKETPYVFFYMWISDFM